MDSELLNIMMLGVKVPWYPPVGGTSVVSYQLAEALAKVGHHVDYVAVAPRNSHRDTQYARARYLSGEPGSLVFPPSLLFPWYEYLKTSGKMKEYDVVQCMAEYGALHALHKAALGGRPRLAVTMYSSGIPRRFRQRRSPFELYTHISLRLADLVLCPSEYSRRNVAEAYGIPYSRTRAFHGGVGSSFLSQIPQRAHTGTFTLLFCGRLNGTRRPVKLVHGLLEAMPRILQKHRAQLNLVGSGARLDDYARLARTLGIEKHVHFLGHVDQSEIPAHYAAADVFVLPSRMENFPLVVLEAMASGLPVVATAVGGIPEAVVDGETGFLVGPDDPDALAAAIVSLLDNPERMRAMGAKGRARVREYFTWDKTAERVARFFGEIV